MLTLHSLIYLYQPGYISSEGEWAQIVQGVDSRSQIDFRFLPLLCGLILNVVSAQKQRECFIAEIVPAIYLLIIQ